MFCEGVKMKLMGKIPLFLTIFFITVVPLIILSWFIDYLLSNQANSWFSLGFAVFMSLLFGLVLAFYKAFTLYEYETKILLDDTSSKFRKRSDSAMRAIDYRRPKLMGNIWIYNPSNKNGFPKFPIKVKIIDGRFAQIRGPKKWVDKYLKTLHMTGPVKMYC